MVIAIFWVNTENLVGLVERDESRTIEEQVSTWEKSHKRKNCFGVEMEVEK